MVGEMVSFLKSNAEDIALSLGTLAVSLSSWVLTFQLSIHVKKGQ